MGLERGSELISVPDLFMRVDVCSYDARRRNVIQAAQNSKIKITCTVRPEFVNAPKENRAETSICL